MSTEEQDNAKIRARAFLIERGVDPVNHGGAGMRTFLNIAELWSLSDDEQIDMLDIEDPAVFEQWKVQVRSNEAVAIPIDVIVRIGRILSIYRSLVTLFPVERTPERAKGRYPSAPGTSQSSRESCSPRVPPLPIRVPLLPASPCTMRPRRMLLGVGWNSGPAQPPYRVHATRSPSPFQCIARRCRELARAERPDSADHTMPVAGFNFAYAG